MQLERWTLMVSTMIWCFSLVKLRQRNEDASGWRYIAVEFASTWRGLGAEVDLLYRKELPLSFDDEMRSIVASKLEGRGIRLHPATNLTELSKTAAGIEVVTNKGDELIAMVFCLTLVICSV